MLTFFARIGEHLAAAWFWVRAHLLGGTVDVTQITPHLWTGGTVESNADVAWLVAQGITADIDAQEEHDDGPLIGSEKIEYYWAPQTDDGQPKPVEWFAGAWKFAQPILASGGVVLSHCAAGHNRGPSMCYFLLRASTKMPAADALALVKAKRPVATVAYAPDADRAITALGL